MIKRYLFLILLGIFLINSSFSASVPIFQCGIGTGTTPSDVCNNYGGDPIFFLNSLFHQPSFPDKIISSKVSLNFNLPFNNKAICCKVNSPTVNNLQFSTNTPATSNCNSGDKELLYFTNSINSKVGYPNSPGFNKADYTNKLCVKIPTNYSNLDILINDSADYGAAGYTCLFKTNENHNSLVSSCDSTFGLFGENYKYTVWAKLWESITSIKCNADCTSKLDNRIYKNCGQKILACKIVPTVCDGALIGSWVKRNPITHPNSDVKCIAPWNIFRSKTFTNQSVEVKTKNINKCLNIINKKYSVIYNNELVTMRIYTCIN